MEQPNICTTEGCEKPSRNKRKPGPCAGCAQSQRRSRPVCRSQNCRTHLQKGKSKLGYCRRHEGELFADWSMEEHREVWKRFGEQVTRNPNTGCWECNEAYLIDNDRGTNRYGRFCVGSDWWVMHRFAYVWAYGGHKDSEVLDHLCNNTRCANPTHVYPTTPTRNIKFRDQRASDPQEDWTAWVPCDREGNEIQPVINEPVMWACFWAGLEP